ncbi:dynamin family protein [Actinomadura macrotermitis]|uniref:Dynamin N-terminal domain-containing protein n=1 Tax=Actinomadura macrotermitis TaxID=2585200 RepID=A0A7K0BPJ0_9ACTN|nr:dynamin family protein [Actinomadura macrotermitis]MQY03073.1 hypothetical protein [Actinomadura macrotermitis]
MGDSSAGTVLPATAAARDRLVAAAIALATGHGLDDLAGRLRRAAAPDRPASCRVCFLGSFSTGKSHLINQLLGRPMLPVGEPPTTRAVVTVRPGDPAADGAGVRHCDAPWLREADLELIDTPGTDTDPGDAPALVAPGCDVAVVTVRAVGGLNLQERELLRDLALVHRVPVVLVVVTMLDHLRGDPAPVLARARAIAAGVGPAIEVLPGPSGDGAVPARPADLAALRRRLAEAARDDGRAAARDRQIVALLTAACAHMLALAGEVEAARDDAGAARARARIESERATARVRWQALRVDLDDRRRQARARVRAAASAPWDETAAEIGRLAAASADPAACWREEVVPLLRRAAAARLAATGAALDTAFGADAAWLEAGLTGMIGAVAGLDGARAAADVEGALDPPADAVRAARRWGRMLFEGGALALDVALALTPLAPLNVLSVRLWEHLRRRFGGGAEDGRRLVAETAAHVLEGFAAELADGAAERADAMYGRLAEAAEDWHEAWWRTRLALWEDDGEPRARGRRLRFEAGRLAAEAAALAREMGST